TNTHTSRVPLDRYQRKQTLTNAERYTTDELVDLERKVISAKTRRAELELEIFSELKNRLLADAQWFLKLAYFVSEVDVLTSLAWTAVERNYTRPYFSKEGHIQLQASRHPVVERATRFVANDILLNRNECLLLTGPNMAGKSTVMRQVAVIALMAQVGSYVPASHAELPLFDRIFTRIGASDSLTEGLSTFMVEMKETATMLNEATENSLVVLDEVGRGTSTYDGLSLAQAILEYLVTKRKPMVLFATHYHELTRLATQYPHIHNAHMSIHQEKGDLHFLYTLTQGAAGRSYGVQVAKLAGLPKEVTNRAEKLLQSLENGGAMVSVPQLDLWAQAMHETEVDDSMEERHKELLVELKNFSIQRMTPLDALNKIAEWQQELS
ncbi:MAG: DNA mismatch repair protein MutS, partial [Bdellovibrionaceae bacterium]|nr:DNA mismatch repair protein MutS [Pseudobdellovibrionaceae bacterium]